MIPRVDRLESAPIVGRYYMVPTVRLTWHNLLETWPVIGPAHTDVEFFDFSSEHYHIDGRFLTARQIDLIELYAPWRSVAAELQAAPLHAFKRGEALPKPIVLKRRCSSAHHPYEHGDKSQILDLRKHYAGSQCERGKAGWICPHRKAQLGSIQAIDGIITCPLHGLQFDAATGRTVADKTGGE